MKSPLRTKTTRRNFLTLAGAASAALVAPSILRATGKPASQPNIVLLFIDDMGWKDWSGGGSDYFKTPNIDRIAERGVNFTQGYVNAANCAPSRCAILSGQYTPRNHFYNVHSIHRGHPKTDRLSLKDVTDGQVFADKKTSFAEAMKKAGYRCGMYGKWHVSGHGKKGAGDGGVTPKMQGFDDVLEHGASTWKKDRNDPKKMFTYTKQAMGFAETCVDENKPFLIYLAHHAVHCPSEARPETIKEYKAKPRGNFHNKVDPVYGAMMADTDTTIGMMLDKLKELKVEDNTIVIFLSDNGGTPGTRASQGELRSWKGSYYEGGIRVPFLVSWPGTIKPGVNNTPVMAIDLYPTMLKWAGVKNIKAHLGDYPIDGQSILPLLTGKGEFKERPLFWHFPAYLPRNPKYTQSRVKGYRQQPVSVIRRGDWKLMLFMEEWSLDGGRAKIATNNAIELYNLKADPSEKSNLALKEIKVRDRLLDELLAWQKSIGAPIPKEPNPDRVAK
ncbi:MAG: sulfatase [Phycisphaerales bacterium]|jgi:arylsulfatase A-like enzyme|nr:sulfatase [Phycisphaerales bacterium]MBT7170199.1 sulfatase [Phycisphaerales bacterium]